MVSLRWTPLRKMLKQVREWLCDFLSSRQIIFKDLKWEHTGGLHSSIASIFSFFNCKYVRSLDLRLQAFPSAFPFLFFLSPSLIPFSFSPPFSFHILCSQYFSSSALFWWLFEFADSFLCWIQLAVKSIHWIFHVKYCISKF